MPKLVQVEQIEMKYTMGAADLRVLRDVNFDIEQGAIIALVGASGSGKTTLLNLLGGLDKPTTGSVLFDGRDIYNLKEKALALFRGKSIGFVFQSYCLLPELDVLENVMLPARRFPDSGMFSGSARERAERLLQAVGLSDRVKHLPSELSGGEQQRVAIARAMINEPELLLADEPTGNLDSVTGRQVLKYLFDLTRVGGKTLVMVTHNIELARSCDKIFELKDGCLASL